MSQPGPNRQCRRVRERAGSRIEGGTAICGGSRLLSIQMARSHAFPASRRASGTSSKMSKLEALRKAQLGMLTEGLKRGLVRDDVPDKPAQARTPPYCWAAFVLSGDWR